MKRFYIILILFRKIFLRLNTRNKNKLFKIINRTTLKIIKYYRIALMFNYYFGFFKR